MSFRCFLLAGALAMVFAACESGMRLPGAPVVAGGKSAVPEKNSNSTPVFSNAAEIIKLRAGEFFAVRLASNPTTGYRWRMNELTADAPLRLQEYRFEPPNYSPPRVGAGGHEYWLFQALAPASVTLQFDYLRPWEPENIHTQCVFRVEILPGR